MKNIKIKIFRSIMQGLSYLLPVRLLRYLIIKCDSLILERILMIKYIRKISSADDPFNEIDECGVYYKFEGDFNEFSVFNMCYLADMLGKALFAVAMGIKPKFCVLDKEGENYFDTFFENTILENDEVVSYKLSTIDGNTGSPHWYATDIENKAYSLLYKKFFRLKNGIKEQLLNEYHNVKKLTGGVLYGCVIRGTDYIIKKPLGHPVQPKIEDLVEKLHDVMKDSDILYLATEEEKIFNLISDEFPGQVVASQSKYYDSIYSSENKNISEFSFERPNDKYLRGVEYFERVFVLSKCDAYIGGMSGASRMAIIMNGGSYDSIILFNLGLY